MSQKKPAHPKHVPLRTCVGCREALAKRALVRVVRGSEGIRIDPSGKASGRGAYVHERRVCWEKALRGSLGEALKVELTAADREALEEHMRRLDPAEESISDPGKPAGGAE